MSEKKKQGALRLYKSYMFTDKDPVIFRIKTMMGRSTYKDVAADSGINAHTLYNWFSGPTQRPQFATIVAVVRALGYDIQITERGKRQPTDNIVSMAEHNHRRRSNGQPGLRVAATR